MNNTPESSEIIPNKQTTISDKSVKFIKMASILMGVLIIIGLVAFIFGVRQKLLVPAELFSEVEISIAEGEKILSVSPDGEGGILLWIENSSSPDKEQYIKHVNKVGIVVKQYFFNSK